MFDGAIKNWQPFPDTVAALAALKQKNKLAVISNIDDELLADTAKHLKVELEWLITAEKVRSYQPSTRNFEIALATMEIAPEKLLDVAGSIYSTFRCYEVQSIIGISDSQS